MVMVHWIELGLLDVISGLLYIINGLVRFTFTTLNDHATCTPPRFVG